MELNCFHVFYWTWLCIWVTWRVSYKKQELFTLREHLRVFWWGPCCSYFLFCLCCTIMCLYVLSSVLWCPLRFSHENDVRFVFTSVVCRRAHVLFTFVLCIVVSNTYCVVFLFCFSLSCVTYVASFCGLFFFDCPIGIL
jgi:hypothetical protein